MTRRYGGKALFLALAATGALALGAPARAAEDCAICHTDVAGAFAKTAHGQTFAGNKAYASASCTAHVVSALVHLKF